MYREEDRAPAATGTLRPASAADVEDLVRRANETQTPLVPFSSDGPSCHGGSVPSVPGAVRVDLRGMNRILRIDRRNRLALIEPGVTYGALVPALAAEGLQIAMPLAPRRGKSVIASLLEREPITWPRVHWNPMEPLRSLEVVWGNGERLCTGTGHFRGGTDADWAEGRIPVMSGGPGQIDFIRMVSGAQGTMGIVTWASVKCEPSALPARCLFVPADRLEDLVGLTARLLRIRFGDETLLLNRTAMRLLLRAAGAAADTLPAWSLVVAIGGGPLLGAEKVAGREADVREMAAAAGLPVLEALPGWTGDEMLTLLRSPSAEPYWREGARDVFCLAPIDRTTGLVAAARVAAGDGIGVYLQPIHQGAGCHLEVLLPFGQVEEARAEAADRLSDDVFHALFASGGWFSRPYGSWAGPVFAADPATTALSRTMKGIFDPLGVMNPGRLCFPVQVPGSTSDTEAPAWH